MAMDKAKLSKYQEKLIQAKMEILKELGNDEDYIVYDKHGDLVDIADSIIYNEIKNQLSNIDLEKVHQIENALEKIKNGTYGICEGTKKKISVPMLYMR